MDEFTAAVLAIAVPFIAEQEGFSATPYRDAGGKPTIGFGFTYDEQGHAVTMATPPMTRNAAMARLTVLVTSYVTSVVAMVHRPLTPNQAAALTSFAYNEGTGALRGSRLMTLINQGDMAGAAEQFGAWVYGGSKKLQGLVNRRAAERAMFLDESGAADALDAEYNK